MKERERGKGADGKVGMGPGVQVPGMLESGARPTRPRLSGRLPFCESFPGMFPFF